MSELPSDGSPIVLLCECAGMMGNIDFGAIEAGLGPQVRMLRRDVTGATGNRNPA